MAFFAKFTERGQRALIAAQTEAAQLGRTYVGTEHLLLGVLTDPGAAAGVLKGLPWMQPATKSLPSWAGVRTASRASRWSIPPAPRR